MASARRVVVTGGSRGIGRAVVARFASLGDQVVAVGRDREALEAVARQGGAGVTVSCCDLTDESAVDALMAELGVVDVLVNNAGSSDSAPLHQDHA